MVAVLSAAAAAGSLVIALQVLEGIPHVSDEISYVFQGRIFASGHLWLPPPPVPEVFRQQNVILTPTRWCSKYPPGWPLLLALGCLAGAPWIVNPILLGLAIFGIHRLGRLLFDERTALLSAVGLAVSPFALLMAAGTMAHVAALGAAIWCMSCLVEGANTGRPRCFLAAGAAFGLAFLVRPMTAVALLWPIAVWSIWRLPGQRGRALGLAWLAAGAAPFVAALLVYDALAFGRPLATGYSVYDATERLTGVAGRYVPLAQLAAERLPSYLRDLGRAVWGLPVSDFLVLAPLLIPARGRRRDLLLAGCAASLVAAHSLYYFYDVVYSGPRFAFESLSVIPILGARAVLAVTGAARDRLGRRIARPHPVVRRLSLSAAACVLLAFPLGVRLPGQLRHHAHAYHGQSAEPLRRADGARVGEDALVFVAGEDFVYGSFFLQNALDPTAGRRVYVRAREPDRDEVVTRFPRREIWRVRVDLHPRPGPNVYPDAWDLAGVRWSRLDGALRPGVRAPGSGPR